MGVPSEAQSNQRQAEGSDQPGSNSLIVTSDVKVTLVKTIPVSLGVTSTACLSLNPEFCFSETLIQ